MDGQAAGFGDQIDRRWLAVDRGEDLLFDFVEEQFGRLADLRAIGRSIFSASGPSSARMSSTDSTSFAPSLINAWQPWESRLSIGPGTAKTSRPCS